MPEGKVKGIGNTRKGDKTLVIDKGKKDIIIPLKRGSKK